MSIFIRTYEQNKQQETHSVQGENSLSEHEKRAQENDSQIHLFH